MHFFWNFTQSSSRKRTNFDTEDEPALNTNDSNDSNGEGFEVASNNVADEPEEVTANSIEVLKMKEMHEKIVESTLRRSKRRKVTATKSTENADVALDQSIFDSLAQDEDEGDSEEESDDDEDAPSWKIDIKRSNSRKM